MISSILSAAALASAPVPEVPMTDRQEQFVTCAKQAVLHITGEQEADVNLQNDKGLLYSVSTETEKGPLTTLLYVDPSDNDITILNIFKPVAEDSSTQTAAVVMSMDVPPRIVAQIEPVIRYDQPDKGLAHTLVDRQDTAIALYRDCAMKLAK
jgi:hypothetical protein